MVNKPEKVEIRTAESLSAAGEALVAIFRPTPGFKVENVSQFSIGFELLHSQHLSAGCSC